MNAHNNPLVLFLVLGAGLLASVAHAASQDPAEWHLSAEAVEMGDGADELFTSVGYGRILPDGHLVVADAGELVIRIYAPDGERIAEMGGEGDGPGELRALQGVWEVSGGRIGAWDPRQLRVTLFDLEGSLVDSHGVSAEGRLPPGSLDVYHGSFNDDALLLAAIEFGEREGPDEVVADRWTVARFGLEGELYEVLGAMRGFRRAARGPLPFTPVPQVVVRDDSLWVAHAYEPRITVRDGRGAAARTIQLDRLEPYPGDSRAAHAALEEELRQRDRSSFLNLLDQVPETDRFPAIAAMLVDDETGHVWVKAYDPAVDALWLKGSGTRMGQGGRWTVVDGEGRAVAETQVPTELELLHVRGGRLLAIARDEWDVERVVLHEIER